MTGFYPMDTPKWQQRIRANTARIVAGITTPRWGRAYANFLREQADQIDKVLGLPEHTAKRERRFRQKTQLYNAIKQLITAHPALSSYKAAQLTGGPTMTVYRYMKHIRERFGINPDSKPATFMGNRQVVVPEDIDDFEVDPYDVESDPPREEFDWVDAV